MAAWNGEDRRTFGQDLAQAGWDVEGWDAARSVGARVDLDAEAEYAGAFVSLRLELPVRHRYVTLQVSKPDGELMLCLRFRPRSDLAPILAQIVSMQDTLDADTHPILVKSLIPLCDPLLIETDEGVFRLS